MSDSKGEIEDMTKMIEVPINDCAKTTCPLCGQEAQAPWGDDGMLVWWPKAGDCAHYRGAYASGRTDTVQMSFA